MDYNQRIVYFQVAVSFECANKDKLDFGGYKLGYKIYSLGTRYTEFITPSLKYFLQLFFSSNCSCTSFQSSRFELWLDS